MRQPATPVAWSVEDVLDWLHGHASATVLDEMGPRYGIHTTKAFGVPMAQMKRLAKQIGVNHRLAVELWDTDWYEAQIVAAMIDDPAAVSGEQMDSWCVSFDNWAICDTVCFNLFDRTPHAWSKVDQWASSSAEYVKRTAFALLWSLALHDMDAGDEAFVHGLSIVERNAHDERHLVSKSMSMAMRAIAHRNPTLADAVTDVAQRLATSDSKASRSIGAKYLRERKQRS
jgi:3-methyladenine DNA glycosylase AlkD